MSQMVVEHSHSHRASPSLKHSKFMHGLLTDSEKAESHVQHMKNSDYIESWLKNPVFKKIQDAMPSSNDETSQISQLIDTMLAGYSQPATFGRDLCTTAFTSQEEIKVPLFTRGKAVQTGKRGVWSVHSSGPSTEFKKVHCDQFLQNRSEFDETAREDFTPAQLMYQNQNAVDAMAVAETEIILKKFEDERSNGIRITKGSGSGEINAASLDLLIRLHGKLAEKDRPVNYWVMSPATKTTLLLDEDVQRSDFFEGVNRDFGDDGISGRILGADLMCSSLVPDNVIYGINKIAMLYVIRSDMLLMPFNNLETRISGVTIRHRFGLETGRIDEGLVSWY